MKPQTYHEDEDWESYLNHFEVCLSLEDWLTMILKGKYSSLLHGIDFSRKVSVSHTDSKEGLRFGNIRH